MKTKVAVALLAVVVIALYFLIFDIRPREVSMLLVNGVVYTLNDQQPLAEAVAIDGGRIAAVGSSKELMAAYKSDRVIDLRGKCVYPGFVDSHGHLENLGIVFTNLDLTGTSSAEEILSMVAKAVPQKKAGEWLRGRGWNQELWKHKVFPTHQMLDGVSGNTPVYLTRIDGHAVWVNARVLALAGITRSTPDPPGGRIVRDGNGNPTGVFVDNAVDLLLKVLPEPTDEERMETIGMAAQRCIAVGLTEIHDMGADLQEISLYKRMFGEGKLPIRLYVAVADLPPPDDSTGFGPDAR